MDNFNEDISSLIFEEESYTPEDFLAKANCAELIKLSIEDDADIGNSLDLSKPFLFYSHRRRTKLYIRATYSNSENENIIMELPKDYPGLWDWMSIDSDANKSKNSIKEVVLSKTGHFLTRTLINGFELNQDDSDQNLNGDYSTQKQKDALVSMGNPCKIYPGEVLSIIDTNIKSKSIKSKPFSKAKNDFVKCSRCSVKNKQVYIPMRHAGNYRTIENNTNNSVDFWSLINSYKFPKKVELLNGSIPNIIAEKDGFDGVFEIISLARPDTFLLFNILDDKLLMIELPFMEDLKIHRLKDISIHKEAWVKDLIKACGETVYQFVTGMKMVLHPVKVKKDVKRKKDPIYCVAPIQHSSHESGTKYSIDGVNFMDLSEISPPNNSMEKFALGLSIDHESSEFNC